MPEQLPALSGLQSIVIKQGDCDSTHPCVPCTTPTGSPKGAHGRQ